MDTMTEFTNVFTALLGRYHKLEGFKLENTSGSDFNVIDVFADSLVMFDVIVTGFNSSSDEVLRYRNFDVDDNRGNYYVDIDSIQLFGGRQIDINVEGTNSQVSGSIKIVNSVFKNAVHHNIDLDFRNAVFQEVLIKSNLFQDNDLGALLAFFTPSAMSTMPRRRGFRPAKDIFYRFSKNNCIQYEVCLHLTHESRQTFLSVTC